jgi:hypothetical protein
MKTRMAMLLACTLLMTVTMAPTALAAKAGKAETSCTMAHAQAEASGGTPSAVAQMFGGTDHDYYYSDDTLAHEDVAGNGGSTATADNGSQHAHCNAHGDATCTDDVGVTAISSPDTTSAIKTVSYRGFIGFVPAASAYWFFGTVNRDGLVLPFAAALDSSGMLLLTASTVPTAAPTGLNVAACLPIDVDLA